MPISRACITGQKRNTNLKRIIIHPNTYGFSGNDIKWNNLETWKIQAFEALENKGPLIKSVIWNAGLYLWFAGISANLEEGLSKAQEYLTSGEVRYYLKEMINWRKNIE